MAPRNRASTIRRSNCVRLVKGLLVLPYAQGFSKMDASRRAKKMSELFPAVKMKCDRGAWLSTGRGRESRARKLNGIGEEEQKKKCTGGVQSMGVVSSQSEILQAR